LGRAFRQFTIYNSILRLTKQALKEAVKTIQELDKSLTEQAMVTGMTREQTYGLMKSYQDLALQCGATTKEIAQVATEYMKQGKTIEDSLILTEAAVKAAKVARVSVGDSVNYLTTALNGFRLSAEDAMLVSDKFAAVAAASATDYDELAIALSKVASQANLAGMSIDYTTALLTKGLETTREAPETMGTALKTIIARMRELGDYGETLEGDTDVNNVEAQLAYVNIALRDANGELLSTEDVLDQLGQKWDTLNKNQQAAVAKALAGTRQQSRLIAMMEDYERVTELQQISMRSAGATSAQAATYLSGLEAKLNSIQVAWEKITTTITDSELIIGTFEFIGDFLDKIAEYMDS
jgi:TP901 family phage tail tape measure protein